MPAAPFAIAKVRAAMAFSSLDAVEGIWYVPECECDRLREGGCNGSDIRDELAELFKVYGGERNDGPNIGMSGLSSSEVKAEVSDTDGSTGEEQRSLLSGETKVDGISSNEVWSTSITLIDRARFL